MTNIVKTGGRKQRVIVKRVDLTPKEAKYVAAYCCIGADTCSNQGKSALAAGFSQKNAATQATRLMREPRIKQAILDFHQQLMDRASINPAKILADLENTKNLALAKGDLVSANRSIHLQGQYLTMFSDRVVLEREIVEQRQLDDVESELAAEIVKNIHLGTGGQTPHRRPKSKNAL